jgi:mannose-6-phosphate isomerase-like protein (cupin superfamily)
MMETGRRYELPSGTSLVVVDNPHENGGERIVFDRVMAPGKGKADPHYHLDCDQSYEFLEGTATIEVDGERSRRGPGDTAEVPRGTGHRDPYNASDEPIRFRATITPCPPFITAFGDALAHSFEHRRVNSQDELPLIQIFMMASAFEGQSFRTGIPSSLQRAIAPAVAAVGRLRGYRASYD